MGKSLLLSSRNICAALMASIVVCLGAYGAWLMMSSALSGNPAIFYGVACDLWAKSLLLIVPAVACLYLVQSDKEHRALYISYFGLFGLGLFSLYGVGILTSAILCGKVLATIGWLYAIMFVACAIFFATKYFIHTELGLKVDYSDEECYEENPINTAIG